MAISFDMITEIDDVSFDRMFNDCIDNMNAGSYPWELTPVATGTNEEKRVFIKAQYQGFLDASDGVVFVCSEDGYALTISNGLVDGTHFTGTMILIGRNQAGSKSYMHHVDYHTAREAFWDDVNFLTWDFQTLGPNTAFYDHVKTVYDETVSADPTWLTDARTRRGKDEVSITGTAIPGTANTVIVPEAEVTEHQMGNSSLKITVHEQIVRGEDPTDANDDPTGQIWIDGVANTVGE